MLESINIDSLTTTYLVPWGIRVGFALLIFIGGRIIVSIIGRIVKKLLIKAKMD